MKGQLLRSFPVTEPSCLACGYVMLSDAEIALAYELASNAGAFRKDKLSREPYRMSPRSNEEQMRLWRERKRDNHKRRRATARQSSGAAKAG